MFNKKEDYTFAPMAAQKTGLTANRGPIIHGLRDGIPIAMGYFAVAFSLGIIAAKAGLSAPEGFLSSFFTRASAGEYGTYTLVAVQAAYAEVIAMCLVANLRYMLMSAALSQKIAPGTSWFHRLLMACCVTDEVFGISIAHPGYTPPAYTYSALMQFRDRLRHRKSYTVARFFTVMRCIATVESLKESRIISVFAISEIV